MNGYGASDCIAMSEDGDWFAYPKTMTRGQAMSAVARSADDLGYADWHDTLKRFQVRAGYVYPDNGGTYGTTWHFECDADHPRAIPCWIVKLKPARGVVGAANHDDTGAQDA